MSFNDLPLEILQPAGLMGREQDMKPWEVLCIDHGIQTGRLTDDAHFGEASNFGLCETCLVTRFVRCKKHGAQPKSENNGCVICESEAAVAGRADATPAGGAEPVGDLPAPGADGRSGVLAAPVRVGPAPFGGISDGAGGWSRPAEVSGGGGDGAGDPPAGREPTAVPSAPPRLEEAQVHVVSGAGPRPPELPITEKFRALAATGLLRRLTEAHPTKEEAE